MLPDGRVVASVKCPKGHTTKVYNTPQQWRDGLMAGTLQFSCGECGDAQQYYFSDSNTTDILRALRVRGLI
jgi:hypothetical protein